jgi:hypothetical protein
MARFFSVVPLLLVLAGCDYSQAPQAAPLHLLVAELETHENVRVVTGGVVRTFDSPRHYWIEDDALHRVEIHPMHAVADYVGQTVAVTGTFHFAADKGRWIEAEKVRVR